ncbi:bifunctional adenosylcobinamide kinase/adenosylcobinamide-phosphate guanylyltransferase [Pseudaeromonas sp. ZJS20]|uniref:bifunctional adenosylcobinamide kinase/adenosylcobinamide-phosphate guanylyltransferase n=1 Tax=Pseudaeromonas aegiceratis TaxID=3153928 RepID=UPI00390C9275
MAHVTLILGGARSGKSALAERLARGSGKAVTYIATAQAGDEEMAARIAHHQARRPAHWRLVEAPLALVPTLRREAAADTLLLVDCLTLWLTNLLCQPQPPDEAALATCMAELLDQLAGLPGEVLLVSNEVGLGIVPMGALSRRFVDEAGRLNQALAAQARRVAFVAAGLPLWLKGAPTQHQGGSHD